DISLVGWQRHPGGAPGPGARAIQVTTRSTNDIKHAQLWGGLLASPEMNQIAALFPTDCESRLPRLRVPTQLAIIVSGLGGSARALFLAALEKRTGRQVVFLTRSNREIEDIQPDVEFFYAALNGSFPEQIDQSPVVAIPSSDSDPYDGASPHPDVLEQRALALYRAARARGAIAEAGMGG